MASPFVDELFTFRNPDDSEVTLRGWGNQFEAVFESLDGYTVVRNGSGYYEYASLASDGESLVPTGSRVGEVNPESLGLSKHIRLTRDAVRREADAARAAMGPTPRWMQRRQEKRARQIAGPGENPDVGKAPPTQTTSGHYHGLVLLIDFSDFPQAIGRQEVDDFCNKVGYKGFGNNGSAYDYFYDVSDGKLMYTNRVAAYCRASHPRTYYTDPAISYPQRAQELIREALDSLVRSGFDFSGLTADSSGAIQALSVFYAGARSNNWSEGLWPHCSTLASPYSIAGGRRFADYQITDLGNQLTLRTFCHENGHMICDFPDLYDYDKVNVGYGIGNYSLMCYGGSDTNPTQVEAYLKYYAGWGSNVTILKPGMTTTIKAGKNDFLLHSRNPSEFFILENRQQSGRDVALPGAGLAIWHVDVNGNNSYEQMTAREHYECSLEQADNRFDLERSANLGDAEDLYGSKARTFGAATAPSSHWWDGTPSGLEIEQISPAGAAMTVKTRDVGVEKFLFYDSAAGDGAVGKIDQDGFQTTESFTQGSLGTNWGIVEPYLYGVVFYNSATGGVSLGHSIDDKFRITATQPPGFLARSWTYIGEGPDGNLLFYRATTGEAAIVRGWITTRMYPKGSFMPGWSHIARPWSELALFYNAKTGAGAVVEWFDNSISAGSIFSTTNDIRTVKTYGDGSFATGWSSIVPIADGRLLFYNKANGAGAVGELSTSGFSGLESYPAGSFAPGWTHIASHGKTVMFYNGGDGSAALGFNPTRKVYPPGSFKSGWTRIVPLAELL